MVLNDREWWLRWLWSILDGVYFADLDDLDSSEVLRNAELQRVSGSVSHHPKLIQHWSLTQNWSVAILAQDSQCFIMFFAFDHLPNFIQPHAQDVDLGAGQIVAAFEALAWSWYERTCSSATHWGKTGLPQHVVDPCFEGLRPLVARRLYQIICELMCDWIS